MPIFRIAGPSFPCRFGISLFFLFKEILVSLSFFASFPRILGVRLRGNILAVFCGVFPFFSKMAKKIREHADFSHRKARPQDFHRSFCGTFPVHSEKPKGVLASLVKNVWHR